MYYYFTRDPCSESVPFRLKKGILGSKKIACALCNVIFLEKLGQADPIDRALISFAFENGVDIHDVSLKYRRIYDKPFNSENRYMASGFEHGGRRVYFAEGDPEIILKMCKSYISMEGVEEGYDLDSWTSISLGMRRLS